MPPFMAWLAGVDGCPKGWFRACRESASGGLQFDLFTDVADIWAAWPRPEIVGIDMPIGLSRADLTPPSRGVPLDLSGPLHPDYAEPGT